VNKNNKNIREDEMWCPECGAPIKKGFFTCANCRFKVKLTEDINKKQTGKKKKLKTSRTISEAASKSKKSLEKKKGVPEPEKSSKSIQRSAAADKDRKEMLDDIFEEDAADPENKKSGSRPGWWNYN
jgi:uncharacterized Zn finger protein (UPF0148 family)